MSRKVIIRPKDSQRARRPAPPERKKPSLEDVREGAAKVTSGLAGGLNIVGALAKAAGVMVAHVVPGGGPFAGRTLGAIGEQLVDAAQGLGAASSLIGGTVIPAGEPAEGVVDAEVVDETKVPPGRKPRQSP